MEERPRKGHGAGQVDDPRGRGDDGANRARDLLASVVEHSPDAIVTTDVQGRITYVSPGAGEMFGYPPDEVLGRPVAKSYRGGLDEARAVMRRLRRQGRLRDYETAVRAADGRWVDVSASLALLRDPRGVVIGTLGILHDVTERKRLEAELRQAQKMEAIGRLAGGIAHDFNNLLTIIQGRSHLLLRRVEADDPRRRHLDLIRQTAEQAATLTQQLLAFSRKQSPEPRVLDLSAVAAGMAPMLRRLIGETIELAVAPRTPLGRVKADPGQLEQVILNLAINARDAMPRGGRLTIETEDVELDAAYTARHVGVRPGAYVMLAVTDTGIGMDAATQARLFEPFFTTKPAGQGTGLGLATVYTIVKQSGGGIWVYSEVGRGTTFKVYLPRVDAVASRAEPARLAEPPPRGSETVLLVEDEAGLRDLAREVLEGHGYRVLTGRHGGDALLVAEQQAEPIHLLVTDMVMPQLNGRELAGRLLATRPGLRVLYMSGYADAAITRLAALDGPFVQKPFPPDTLLRKVREALDAPQPAGSLT